ncbi:MAG: hypothetical protein NZM04_08765 [Methylacidiphilales bacterium]|nr:hypothetical protein [Candidatus Methylacidiphilales bacterium]
MLFVNNRVGYEITKWLIDRGENIVGIVLHPYSTAKYRSKILEAVKNVSPTVIDAAMLGSSDTVISISHLSPDIGVCAYFGFILKKEIINIFQRGIVNIHPSYLPYNRGAHPNVWSIIDETPAGASIHWIDEGIDSGDIIDRIKIDIDITDTGESLYYKLEEACICIFKKNWCDIKYGRHGRTRQNLSEGTFHRVADLSSVSYIDLNRWYKAKDIIDQIRALTFRGYKGAYIVENGERIYLRLELLRESDIEREGSLREPM